MKPFAIQGKTVLVTGASSGIGKACAVLFAKEGANVAGTARTVASLSEIDRAVRQFPTPHRGQFEPFPFDLSQTDKIPDLVDQVRKKWGPVDVLVNNAGYAVAGLVEDCPIGQFRKNFDVNFFAPLALIQAVLPDMKQKGAGQIINVSSGVGKRAIPGASSYCATKFALNGLTESLRVEVKPFGIDVLSISPGRVSSEFHNRIETYGRLNRKLPEIKMRTPEEIAKIILSASRHRKREVMVWGPGLIGYHLNYWSPKLVDSLLEKRFPV